MKCIYFFIAIILNYLPLFAAKHTARDVAPTLPVEISAQPVVKVQAKQQDPSALFVSIQKELRDPKYRQEILPNNFSYLLQLLEYGDKTKQERDFILSVMSLFSKLLKGAEYVNASTFSSLIEQIPGLTKRYFTIQQLDGATIQKLSVNDLDMFQRLEKSVTNIIYHKFKQEFAQAKDDPQKFLDDLSQKIVHVTKQEVGIEQLRQTMIRFLEVGMGKLIWNPNDPEQSWNSVKTIAHNLASLMEYNIIEDLNDLDELFWSLTHRYCYFLELNSTEVSLSCYEKIRQDVTMQHLMLFDLEEQEPFMQSKSDCLLQTVMMQEAKKRAYESPATVATPPVI